MKFPAVVNLVTAVSFLSYGVIAAPLADTTSKLKSADLYAYYRMATYHPIFGFDHASCFPNVAVNSEGRKNGGLKPTGHQTGKCRRGFTNNSNTYHRYAKKGKCEMHAYELYFQKDQSHSHSSSDGKCEGHRHDIETVYVLFTNGAPRRFGYSSHEDSAFNWGSATVKWMDFKAIQEKEKEWPKVVYQDQPGICTTHDFRLAWKRETPSNGDWVMPDLASWYEMEGVAGFGNQEMRDLFNSYDFGSARFKITDGEFFAKANEFQKSYCGIGEFADTGMVPVDGYMGCFKDARSRDMPRRLANNLSIEACVKDCGRLGYKYAGVQAGYACFCGHDFNSYGEASNCDKPCRTGEGFCGGSFANSIYSTKKERYHYVGCYQDTSDRDLPILKSKTVQGFDHCMQLCRDGIKYKYAGLQNGNHCFCANDYGAYGALSSRSCNKFCGPENADVCGGAWANSVYRNFEWTPPKRRNLQEVFVQGQDLTRRLEATASLNKLGETFDL